MKKYILILVAGATTGLMSCKKTEPTACFTPSATDVLIGDVVQFENCSNEYLTAEWNFGDGSNANVGDPSHKFNKQGVYNVNLKVLSKDGLTSTSSSEITVNRLGVKSLEIVDFDLSNPVNRFSVLLNGEDITNGSANVVNGSGSMTITFSDLSISSLSGDVLTIIKEEEQDSGWFGTFWNEVARYTYNMNAYDQMDENSQVIITEDAEGMAVTITLEKTSE